MNAFFKIISQSQKLNHVYQNTLESLNFFNASEVEKIMILANASSNPSNYVSKWADLAHTLQKNPPSEVSFRRMLLRLDASWSHLSLSESVTQLTTIYQKTDQLEWWTRYSSNPKLPYYSSDEFKELLGSFCHFLTGVEKNHYPIPKNPPNTIKPYWQGGHQSLDTYTVGLASLTQESPEQTEALNQIKQCVQESKMTQEQADFLCGIIKKSDWQTSPQALVEWAIRLCESVGHTALTLLLTIGFKDTDTTLWVECFQKIIQLESEGFRVPTEVPKKNGG